MCIRDRNKCEEILNASDLLSAQDAVAICVFDLNNLRNINNNLGHDKGDEYIRSFAVQLRIAVADEYFVGRDGGDEFIAVLKNVTRMQVEECLRAVSYTHLMEIHIINKSYKVCSVLPIISSCVFLESTLKKALYPATRTMRSLCFSGCFCASINVSLETILYCT